MRLYIDREVQVVSIHRLKEQASAAFDDLRSVNEVEGVGVRFSFPADTAVTEADVDAFLATYDPDLGTNVERRATNAQTAVQNIRAIWGSQAFQNNVKGKDVAEIESWLAGMGWSGPQAQVLANILVWLRDVTIVLRHIESD